MINMFTVCKEKLKLFLLGTEEEQAVMTQIHEEQDLKEAEDRKLRLQAEAEANGEVKRRNTDFL